MRGQVGGFLRVFGYVIEQHRRERRHRQPHLDRAAGSVDRRREVGDPGLVDLRREGVGAGPGRLARLGTMTARILTPIEPGKRYVVLGWPRGSDGRKLYCGTAVFDQNGGLCAAARSTWVQTGT